MDNLPDELSFKIVTYFSIKNIMDLSLVSHYWYKIANDDNLWKLIYQKEFFYRKLHDLSWKEMFKDYGLVVRSNLYNKKFVDHYKFSTDVHRDFVDCRLYDNRSALFMTGIGKEIIIYNLSNFFEKSKSREYEISEKKNSNRCNTVKTIFGRVHEMHTLDDLIIVAGSSDSGFANNSSVEIVKINHDTNYNITTNQQAVINTYHNNGILKMNTVNDCVITVGNDDPTVNIWDVNSQTSSLLETKLSNISAMNCTPDMIMLGTTNGLIHIYKDTVSPCFVFETKYPGLLDRINNICYDSNKNLVVIGTNQYFSSFDLRSSKCLFKQNIPLTKHGYSYDYRNMTNTKTIEPNFIHHMQYYDQMIVWNSWDYYGGELSIWKLINETNYEDIANINDMFSDVLDFQICDTTLFMSHGNGWASYSVCELINR